MLRRAPLPKRRENPRRDEGRIAHKRIKRRRRFADADEKAYWNSLDRKCVACGSCSDTVIHHILAGIAEKVRRRDHRYVVVLCPGCHNGRADSVHGLGSEERFAQRHGVCLVTIAIRNWNEWSRT